MRGRFDVTLLDAAGKGDAFFQRAIREGTLDQVLPTLKPVQRCHAVSNRIFDNMAGIFLDQLFSLGNVENPYYQGYPSNAAALAFICLLTTDSDTASYTENWWRYAFGGDIGATPLDSIGVTSAGKRFEEDQITPWEIWADTQGRDAIYFRNRFLYLPAEGVSSNIRSIGIHFHQDADSTSTSWVHIARIGRVRLKDDGGNPIILNKSSSQVLLVEYTFTLVAN